MKKLIIIAIGVMLSVQLNAQDAITKFFSEYETDDSFSHVSMTSRMFGLFTDLEIENEEDQAIMDAISKLKGLKVLAKDDTDQGKQLYTAALKKLGGEYDELMSVRDEDKDMKFLIKEKSGKISELLMVMGGDKEFFVLTLFGEIDLKQIAKISRAMDIDGLDQLERMNDKDKNKKN